MGIELVKVHPKVNFVLRAMRIGPGNMVERLHPQRLRAPCFSATAATSKFKLDKRPFRQRQPYLGRASTRLFLCLAFLTLTDQSFTSKPSRKQRPTHPTFSASSSSRLSLAPAVTLASQSALAVGNPLILAFSSASYVIRLSRGDVCARRVDGLR